MAEANQTVTTMEHPQPQNAAVIMSERKHTTQPDHDPEVALSHMLEVNEAPKDLNLVTWDGPNDPDNPKNWPTRQKWINTVLISTFNFISPISSTMAAPALTTIGIDLGMQSKVEVELALSIFVLAYAVGPLFFGPMSEVYGRSRVVQLSNLWFLAWNLGCGFARNSTEMFVCRFLAGIGGSAPLAIGAGTLRLVKIIVNMYQLEC